MLVDKRGQNTRYPFTHYPNYPNPDPNYSNPSYPIPSSDSDFDYPKLVWVIRIISPGIKLPELPKYLSLSLYLSCVVS